MPSTLFPAIYPTPSNHGHILVLRCSKAAIASAFLIVAAISSNPSNKHRLLNASTLNRIGASPESLALRARVISSCSRSTTSSIPASASRASARHSSTLSSMGSMQFWRQLFQNISPKLGAMIQRMPKSSLHKWRRVSSTINQTSLLQYTYKLHAACSRELPHPKFFPVETIITALSCRGVGSRTKSRTASPVLTSRLRL
ncbi:hypothetical protein B0H12DRAFT_411488 [Mycena haematopus]|nr:hypothetical protein B0H12DRAFT_411488 [Mycena haematopus]